MLRFNRMVYTIGCQLWSARDVRGLVSRRLRRSRQVRICPDRGAGHRAIRIVGCRIRTWSIAVIGRLAVDLGHVARRARPRPAAVKADLTGAPHPTEGLAAELRRREIEAGDLRALADGAVHTVRCRDTAAGCQVRLDGDALLGQAQILPSSSGSAGKFDLGGWDIPILVGAIVWPTLELALFRDAGSTEAWAFVVVMVTIGVAHQRLFDALARQARVLDAGRALGRLRDRS